MSFHIGLKDKVEDKEKSDAEEKIKDLKESLEKDDLDDIKKKTEALQEITYALAAKVYQQTAPEENKESSDDNKKDDGVQEAEYEEKQLFRGSHQTSLIYNIQERLWKKLNKDAKQMILINGIYLKFIVVNILLHKEI